MIRLAEIITAFKSLVGWRQDYDPRRAIEEHLTHSASGLMFQDAHPMVTLENIAAIMPQDYDSKYPEWEVENVYAANDKCRYQGRVYLAVEPTQGVSPEANESGWRAYNPLSDYLTEITEAGISRAIQRFSTAKQSAKESTTLVRSEALVDAPGRVANTITPTSKLVGFAFRVLRGVGVTVKLDKIALQMAGASGTVKLYLFHSSQFEPLHTYELDISENVSGFQWMIPSEDLYLTNPCKDTGLDGVYYLCYHESELPEYMRAVNASRDWSRRPCGSCNQGNLSLWNALEQLVTVRPFAAVTAEDFSDNPVCPVSEEMSSEPTLSYGFNFVVQVGCDITDFMIQQGEVFASAVQLEVAYDILRRLALNPNVRVNRNQLNASRAELLYEIDGDTQGRPTGIAARLAAAYKGLEVSTQGIDRICLSCNNRGIRYTQM